MWTVVPGVGCMCQVQTECVRCGLNATDLDWMCQVWTGKVRFGLDVSGVDWICKHTDKTSAVRQKAAANM